MITWKSTCILEKEDKVLFLDFKQQQWIRLSKRAYEESEQYIIHHNSDEIPEEYQKLFRILCQNSLIKDSENKEIEEIPIQNISSLFYLPTLRCNMECDFCCLNSSPSLLGDAPMELDKIEEISSKIAKLPIHKVVITGGEPFVRKDLPKIVQAIRNKVKCKIQICTNALLLKETDIPWLKECVQMLDISVENILENAKKTNGKQQKERFFRKVERLIDAGLEVCLSFVVTRENQDLIYEFLDICNEKKTGISVKVVERIGRAGVNTHLLLSLTEVERFYKKIYEYIFQNQYEGANFEQFVFPTIYPQKACAGYGHLLSVYPNGDVYNCFMLSDDAFRLGNLVEDTIDEIVIKLQEKKYSELFKKCFFICNKGGCAECEVRYFCEGPCSYSLKNGELKQKENVQCLFVKKLYTFIVWHYTSRESFLGNLEVFLSDYEKLDLHMQENWEQITEKQ